MSMTSAAFLRPLRLGELLDRSIRLYRRHFLQFIGIVAIMQIPLAVLQLLGGVLLNLSLTGLADGTPGSGMDTFLPLYAAGSSLSLLNSLLSILLIQGVATVAITRTVADHYLGQPFWRVTEAYRRIRGTWLSMILALLVLGLIGVTAFIWWFLVPILGWITGGGIILFLGWVILPMLAPVVVLEDQPVAEAWRRAWQLVRQRFWGLLAFAFVLFLFNLIVVALPSTFLGVGAGLFALDTLETVDTSATVIQTVLQTAATLLGTLLYVPLQATCFTLIYFDLRVREEGLDLALQARLLAEEGGAGTEMLTDVIREAPRPTAQLITWGEMGKFAVMTLGFLGLLFTFYGLIFLLAFAAF